MTAFAVIACDKREAFAQGSVSDEAIQLLSFPGSVPAHRPAMTGVFITDLLG
jgi:hypothetical protein